MDYPFRLSCLSLRHTRSLVGMTTALIMIGSGASANAAAPTLATLTTTAAYTNTSFGQTASCSVGYLPSKAPALITAPAALPTTGGITFSANDVTLWKSRIADGKQFINNNDFKQGSPGDWARIKQNASLFLTSGEVVITPTTDRAALGALARDGAFYYLMTGDVKYRDAVRNYLLATAANPINDFTTICYRHPDGSANGEALFVPAVWFTRYLSTYDYVRAGLPAADRLLIEQYVQRQSHNFTTQLDYWMAAIFPNRMAGDYTARARRCTKKRCGDLVDATL